jgi:hypothetical protein
VKAIRLLAAGRKRTEAALIEDTPALGGWLALDISNVGTYPCTSFSQQHL